jgi:hypothetical protein
MSGKDFVEEPGEESGTSVNISIGSVEIVILREA